jgi:predicted dinucleotide-binding enzyme
MRIAIIGAGQVGSALARGWTRAGRDVVIGARDGGGDRAAALARQLGVAIRPLAEAAAEADVVVVALPWHAAESAVRALGDLRGKIIIDCMNPLAMRDGVLGLERGFETSGAETLAGWAPGAKVVKTLNQVGAELMERATQLSGRPVMFIAGDHAEANAIAKGLVESLGFEALDAGALRQARLLEPLAMVWINQAILRREGRDWAFGVVRRSA